MNKMVMMKNMARMLKGGPGAGGRLHTVLPRRPFHTAPANANAAAAASAERPSAGVDIKLVKKLRKDTDAPLGQCKKALQETAGDMEAAKEWLRRKGVQLAQKKMGREAVQGLVTVAVAEDALHGAIVEVNSETDFVTRNEKFQQATVQIVQTALRERQDNVEKILSARVEGNADVGAVLTDLVSAIGENIQLRRASIISAEEGGLVAQYVHNAVGNDMGQMGALVAVKPINTTATQDREALVTVARSLAMHVTAMMPRWLTREDVPSHVIEKEKSILRDKAINEGRDTKFLDKMIEGQMKKFYAENVFLEQGWVMDDKMNVSKFLEQNGITVTSYARFKTGQEEEEAPTEQQAQEKKE